MKSPVDGHKCSSSRCNDCGEELHDRGLHFCHIQPQPPKETSKNLIFYDFKTRYENEMFENEKGDVSLILFARSLLRAIDLWPKAPTAWNN